MTSLTPLEEVLLVSAAIGAVVMLVGKPALAFRRRRPPAAEEQEELLTFRRLGADSAADVLERSSSSGPSLASGDDEKESFADVCIHQATSAIETIAKPCQKHHQQFTPHKQRSVFV